MDIVEVTRKDTNSFSKLDCSVCQRKTWHFKSRTGSIKYDLLPHCTEHASKALEHAQKVIKAYDQQAVVHTEPAVLDDTPAQAERVKALELKWRSGHGAVHPRVSLRDEWAAALFEPDDRKEDDIRCSFCDQPTSLVTATVGRGKLRVRTVLEESGTGIGDDISTHEKMIRSQEKVLACPKCVNQLKPQLDKDGRITQQAFKATSTV